MPDHDAVTQPSVNPIATETTAPNHAAAEKSNYELAQRMHALYQRGMSGANWFYIVAALSLVNTAIIHLGGNVQFVVGLGVTLITDSVAAHLATQHPESKTVLLVAAIGFAFVVAAVVAGFGWLARSRRNAFFAIGMVLYLLDGLLFILIQDWMCIAFHVYALFSMWGGFSAFRQLNAIEDQLHQPSGKAETAH